MYKKGEKLIRYCERVRNESYTAIHDFTMWSDALTVKDVPPHVQNLFKHFAKALAYGMPPRDKSSSKAGVTEGLGFEEYETDLLEYSQLAQWQGRGRDQHPVLQNYLAENDPLTIALEVPVWTTDCNGFIDIVRLHPDHRIEIADFKPNARREKKAASQVARYKHMLCEIAHIPPQAVFCTWFDEKDAFILLDA